MMVGFKKHQGKKKHRGENGDERENGVRDHDAPYLGRCPVQPKNGERKGSERRNSPEGVRP